MQETYILETENKTWKFTLSDDTRTTYLSIPDCGGMADMVPRDPEQMEWAEEVFGHIRGLKRVWNTVWQPDNQETIDLVRSLLAEMGASHE